MSSDPSPWAELTGSLDPDIIEPTAQMMAREDDEREQYDREYRQSLRWWNTLAHRLAADGSLIR